MQSRRAIFPLPYEPFDAVEDMGSAAGGAGGAAAPPPDFGGQFFNTFRPPPDFGGFCSEMY